MATKKRDEDPRKPKITFNGKPENGIVVPKGMELQFAIDILLQLKKENEPIKVSHNIDADDKDAALAMLRVAPMVFDGGITPQSTETKTVSIGPDEKTKLEWGIYSVPSIPGMVLLMDWNKEDERRIFTLIAQAKRKDLPVVEELVAAIKADLKRNSIFKGKAMQLATRDSDGDRFYWPEHEFFHPSAVDPVLSGEVMEDVEAGFQIPIRHCERLQARGLSTKRTVGLAGPYGTGKTTLAGKFARYAMQHGWSFFYLKDARDIVKAMKTVRRCQPSVLFVEDIDRVVGLEYDDDGVPVQDRSDEAQAIINEIDGIGNKQDRFMLVYTTNHLDVIHPAMLRPGRTDCMIYVDHPDAAAAAELLKFYGGDQVDPEIDLAASGKLLIGRSPADISEIVTQASFLTLGESDEEATVITFEILARAVSTFDRQRRAQSKARRLRVLLDAEMQQGAPTNGSGKPPSRESGEVRV